MVGRKIHEHVLDVFLGSKKLEFLDEFLGDPFVRGFGCLAKSDMSESAILGHLDEVRKGRLFE